MSNKIETIEDIAKQRQAWKRFVQTEAKGKFVKPVTMVNNGYLHALNASFDGLFLREQGTNSLLEAHHPMNFGTMQPCARIEDRLKSPLHLGLFEIWGTSVLGFEPTSPSQMAESTIREFLTFYKDYLRLNPAALRIFYFGGGKLEDIAKKHSTSQDHIKPDDFSVKIWTDHGLSPTQLIPEYSNETFLLHLANPLREHHSGYRNDIFIDVDGGKPFEIATLNFISHQSVVADKQVTSIEPLPFYLREIAFGQERTLSALNNSGDVFKLPHISPLIEQVSGNRDLIDALRVAHYVISDGWTLDKMTGRKKRQHRRELRSCLTTLVDMKLGEAKLKTLLELNANLQPWHLPLRAGIEATLQEVTLLKEKGKLQLA